MKKRFLSLALVLVMLVGMLPAAFAAPAAGGESPVVFTKTYVPATPMQPAKIKLEVLAKMLWKVR